MGSTSKKRGSLNESEKLYIAEHFLNSSIEEICKKINRTELIVTNYIAKLKHKTKEDIQAEQLEKEKLEKVAIEQKHKNRIVLDTKKTATQMTQEGSAVKVRIGKYKSPFSTR